MAFRVDKKQENNALVISFTGALDEDVILAADLAENASDIKFDLKGITSVNSCGVREWIRWMVAVPPNVSLEFYNTPKAIVDQMNMVASFQPARATVHSFFVPYFCDSCESQKNVLLTAGKEFSGPTVTLPAVSCEKCQSAMEPDIVESSYFKFLKPIK